MNKAGIEVHEFQKPRRSLAKNKRELKSWEERHHYDRGADSLDDLGDAAGIVRALGWCVGYGAFLVLLCWGVVRLVRWLA